ncbi:Hsp20/alpha crystallin family protein [Arenimonas oryziterrae]|uniref:SHSP domain-containing protein n=1 Tax=Arenimonas oryziterrae DSM 21050 = YC6267 TaxID=1121015 RepID=A0A091B1A1_9GAMM|nr:hypothetical protein N789_01265 [Arenimonas oryziterrae DSM 21050 = YC6267]
MSLARHHLRYSHNPLHAELKQVFDHLFNDAAAANTATARWQPRVDIKEEAGRFVILADLPGVDPAAIEISMDKGVLTIQGERKADEPVDGERLARTEREQGAFQRQFTLPDSADAENIVATGKHGVLEIVIPKRPQSTPRRIQVQ